MKSVGKNSILFLIGGLGYYWIEMAYRGHSHWTMFIVGGIVFVLIGLINEYLSWETPLYQQCAISTGVVLFVEFISGLIINVGLGWQVWDYSDLPFNIMGQVCPQFGLIWYFLSIVGIILDDLIRWKFFNEEFKGYRLL